MNFTYTPCNNWHTLMYVLYIQLKVYLQYLNQPV